MRKSRIKLRGLWVLVLMLGMFWVNGCCQNEQGTGAEEEADIVSGSGTVREIKKTLNQSVSEGEVTENSNLYIEIRVNGDIYGSYFLNRDKVIDIGETNICAVKDGKCKMIEATCPKQICVSHKEIKDVGETIICLPNKIVIEVRDAEKDPIEK